MGDLERGALERGALERGALERGASALGESARCVAEAGCTAAMGRAEPRLAQHRSPDLNCSAPAIHATAVDDGLGALRAAASTHVPQTRDVKLAAALAVLETRERDYLLKFEEARKQGKGSGGLLCADRLKELWNAASSVWRRGSWPPLRLHCVPALCACHCQVTPLPWTSTRICGSMRARSWLCSAAIQTISSRGLDGTMVSNDDSASGVHNWGLAWLPRQGPLWPAIYTFGLVVKCECQLPRPLVV